MRDRLDIVMPTIPPSWNNKGYHNEEFGYGELNSLRYEKWKWNSTDLTPVLYNSPLRYKKAVETIARYFMREFQYDCLQYCHLERCPNTVAYLWNELVTTNYAPYNHVGRVFGACCFRYRDEKWGIKENPYWALQWIWIHPFERRKGHLTKALPFFKQCFGDFNIEHPLSEAMQKFVSKNGILTE